MLKQKENILIIYNVRSVENVGAIFRTADAVGVDKIYLIGYTPTPFDRFGRKRKDFTKSALGAEEYVEWEYKKNILPLLTSLKKNDFQIMAIEQDKKSMDYKKVKIKSKNVFILGSEVDGISKNILEKCDIVAEIPMQGKKESLNVSVAFGIFMFRVLNI